MDKHKQNGSQTVKTEKFKKSNYYALIFNGNTIPHIERIPKNVTHFKALNRRFNFSITDVIIFRIKGIFRNKFYLFYDIDNPDPLTLDKNNLKPKYISSDIYNTIIETEIIRQANNRGLGSIIDLIKPQYIIIGLIIVGVIIYLMSGGSIT